VHGKLELNIAFGLSERYGIVLMQAAIVLKGYLKPKNTLS